jgi:hypothetical protein
MTILTLGYPANVLNGAVPAIAQQGVLLAQDVIGGIYSQETASVPAILVGYIPVTADGNGGLAQLSRDYDCSYYPQTQTGFTASISGTTLTVNYPTTPVLYSGAMQTLEAGSISGTVSTGLWSLVVGYYWGLTQVQLIETSAITPNGSYIELCEINVSTSAETATVTNGLVNSKIMNELLVNGTASASYSIPVSDANGNLAW